jgi:ribose-phosphate pyrophosphokinase
MSSPSLAVFALKSSARLGDAIAEALGVARARHEERDFEDGEHKSRPLESVRERDVYVVASLHGSAERSVNDELCRLLFFLGALRDAGAGRITAVVPYLCYARKDRRTKARDPITTRYVASLFEAVGIDRVVTLDVHDLAAYENAFRVPKEHLSMRPLLVDWVEAHLGDEELVVLSPDEGGVKRAEKVREALERRLGRSVEPAFMEKKRSEGKVTGEAFVGEVEGRTALVVDDLIASGTTLARAAEACRARGARRVLAAATHGVFVSGAEEALCHEALERVIVSSSVDPLPLDPAVLESRVLVLDVAPLFAEAIRRLHEGGSLVELTG